MKIIMKICCLAVLCIAALTGKAQSALPNISTADNPAWYYIQVKGSDSERSGRVFTALDDGQVGGRAKIDEPGGSATQDKQLWRFEKSGNDYTVINKATGTKLSLGYDAGKGVRVMFHNSNSNITWNFISYNGRYLIKATSNVESIGGNAAELYAHQANNYNNVRNYVIMFVSTDWYHAEDSQFEFITWVNSALPVSTDENTVWCSITNVNPAYQNYCLADASERGKPYAFSLDPKSDSDTQRWKLVQIGQKYHIINKATGNVIKQASTSDGKYNYTQSAPGVSESSGWSITYLGDGQWEITAVESDNNRRYWCASSVGNEYPDMHINGYSKGTSFAWRFSDPNTTGTATGDKELFLASVENKSIVNKAPLWNPDRGLHQEVIYQIYDDKVMEVYGDHEVYPAGFMADKNRQFSSEGDSITIIQYYLYLSSYIEMDRISDQGLAQIQRMFDALRSERVKAILRFAYCHDYTGSNYNYPNAKPDYTRMTTHIDQLKPIVEANTDVISCWEIGMIGTWGEWNSYYSTAENNAFIKKLIDMLPANQQMMARYVWIKDNFVNQYPTYKNRIGYHDDYFTAGTPSQNGQIGDFVVGKTQFTKIADESFDVRFHAEIPYNENSIYGFNVLIDPAQLLFYFKSLHAQSLDITQNFELNITRWKTLPVTPSFLKSAYVFFDENYFIEADGTPVPRSLYQFVRDHLGYRLNLLPASSIATGEGHIAYDLKLSNTGFGTVLNLTDVYLLVLDDENRIVSEQKLNVNPKSWQPWAKGNDKVLLTHTIAGNVAVNTPGVYRLAIWLPDSHESLKNNAGYDIRLASDNGMISHLRTDDRLINVVSGDISLGQTGIEKPAANNDPVVNVRYFTLMGQEISKLASTGLYILLNMHASGKKTLSKKLVIK